MQRYYNVLQKTLDKRLPLTLVERYFAHCVNVNLTFTFQRLILTNMQRYYNVLQ